LPRSEISKVIVVRAYNKAQLFREFYSPIQIVGPVAQVANLRYTLEISEKKQEGQMAKWQEG